MIGELPMPSFSNSGPSQQPSTSPSLPPVPLRRRRSFERPVCCPPLLLRRVDLVSLGIHRKSSSERGHYFCSNCSDFASRFQEEKTHATGYTSSVVYRRMLSLSRHLHTNHSILPGEVRPVCRRKSCPAASGLRGNLPCFRHFHAPRFRVLPQHVWRLC